MVAAQQMTEYERRRADNLKRNAEKISSLNINSILSNISSSTFKRPRKLQKINYVRSRSSLRTQGITPTDPYGLPYNTKPSNSKTPLSNKELVTMKNVYQGDEESHQSFVEALTALKMKPANNFGRVTLKESVTVESFKLKSENVPRIVPQYPLVIKFLPTSDITVVVAGGRNGHLGFWVVNPRGTNEDGNLHLYQPHSAGIYGVAVHPFSLNKMYSCCYDGFLRLMNIEKEEFEVVYSSSSQSSLYSLSHQPSDANSLFIGEGLGGLNMYDVRAGKVVSSWLPHNERINSINFNPVNTNVMATASKDGLARLWDLRKMNATFMEYDLERSLHSAYFSPSGSCLAITSLGHTVAVLSGANFEDVSIIHRDYTKNPGNPCCSRAIWGWDDTYLYMGWRKRRVEVLSVTQGKAVCTLESTSVSSIPEYFDAHPCKVGMLASASSGGKVFIWTNDDC